jgi:hypothetical protein
VGTPDTVELLCEEVQHEGGVWVGERLRACQMTVTNAARANEKRETRADARAVIII